MVLDRVVLGHWRTTYFAFLLVREGRLREVVLVDLNQTCLAVFAAAGLEPQGVLLVLREVVVCQLLLNLRLQDLHQLLLVLTLPQTELVFLRVLVDQVSVLVHADALRDFEVARELAVAHRHRKHLFEHGKG